MHQRPGFNNDKLKRKHRKAILFNTMELEAINMYCKRYRIQNRSKFLRETVISKILKTIEQDHPTLF
jgi:hypothetical protein